ncbi:MAG: sigma-70 family RNA polymerase sigma factor, partial [Tabrizicola sp.]
MTLVRQNAARRSDPALRSDAELLARFAAGDADAARELAVRHLPRLLSFATRMLQGDRAEAEDVAQETMLRLWRIAPDWRAGEARVSTWLFRVAGNLCTDRLRRQGRRPAMALEEAAEPADGAPGAETRLIADQRLAAL